MERQLLTVDEAAHALGIARTHLYNLMRSGEVRSVKIGASRRIALADVEAFIERLREREGAGV